MSGALTARVGIRNPPASGPPTPVGPSNSGGATDTDAGLGYALASLSIDENGGYAYGRVNAGAGASGSWHPSPAANVGVNYEMRTVETSGTLTTNVNAWTRISSAQVPDVYRDTPGTKTCTFNIEYRAYPGGATLHTATGLVLTATKP